MKKLFALLTALAALGLPAFQTALAWDYENHRVINQLALSSLPTNFPSFARTAVARERIAFLAGEPDRWYNTTDLPLKHANGPEHYLDFEDVEACGLTPETLPMFRYDFVVQLASARAAHPEKFQPFEQTRNSDHTRQLAGFLPWAIAENAAKLKSAFSYLKAFEQDGGTPEEIANAQQNILYVMGVLGHLVGDSAQPLHTTIRHHGWVGDNPHGYTTERSIHQWIDGDYLRKTGGAKVEAMQGKLRPAQVVGNPAKNDDLFRLVMAHLAEQHKQLEPLYQLYKDGKLSGEGEKGLEGKTFLEGQMVKAGQMLGDLWHSAWQQAPEDRFLKDKLAERKAANNAPPTPKQ